MNYTKNENINPVCSIEQELLSAIITQSKCIVKMSKVKELLDHKDFLQKQNGVIFKTIFELIDEDKPVDENFILLKNNKINKQELDEILIKKAQANVLTLAKAVRACSLDREITATAEKIKEGRHDLVSKLQSLFSKKETLEEEKSLMKFTPEFEAFINSLDLDVERIKNRKVEYLYDRFIIKNDISMIVARPGIGKSLLAVALCNIFLSEGKIKRVFYLDGDNSELTISTRNIPALKEKYNDRLNYFVDLTRSKYAEIVNKLKKSDLTDCLVVFDSIKNFIDGDRNNHKDVTESMNSLKILRKNGATVLFLHHQNKLHKEFNSTFAGSSAFVEDVALAFELKKNVDKNALILIPIKDRNNTSDYVAFKYNQNNTLTELDIHYALETNEDIVIREEAIKFLSSCDKKPIASEFLEALMEAGFGKDKSNKVIQRGKNKYWKATRIASENNKLLFELINSETVLNASDKSDRPDKSDKLDIATKAGSPDKSDWSAMSDNYIKKLAINTIGDK